jgi:hypothetical protein
MSIRKLKPANKFKVVKPKQISDAQKKAQMLDFSLHVHGKAILEKTISNVDSQVARAELQAAYARWIESQIKTIVEEIAGVVFTDENVFIDYMLDNFTILVDHTTKDEHGIPNPLNVLKHNNSGDIVCSWYENLNAIEKFTSSAEVLN